MFAQELARLGADLRTDGHHAVVRGVPMLSVAPVVAHDIRAGAALVLAGLAAQGQRWWPSRSTSTAVIRGSRRPWRLSAPTSAACPTDPRLLAPRSIFGTAPRVMNSKGRDARRSRAAGRPHGARERRRNDEQGPGVSGCSTYAGPLRCAPWSTRAGPDHPRRRRRHQPRGVIDMTTLKMSRWPTAWPTKAPQVVLRGASSGIRRMLHLSHMRWMIPIEPWSGRSAVVVPPAGRATLRDVTHLAG